MKVTFVSNYINHHQIPFSNALYERLGADYCFVQTMRWGVDVGKLPYVRCLYEDEYGCRKAIAESDVALFGWSGREDIAQERLRSGKITFRVSERLYREG